MYLVSHTADSAVTLSLYLSVGCSVCHPCVLFMCLGYKGVSLHLSVISFVQSSHEGIPLLRNMYTYTRKLSLPLRKQGTHMQQSLGNAVSNCGPARKTSCLMRVPLSVMLMMMI